MSFLSRYTLTLLCFFVALNSTFIRPARDISNAELAERFKGHFRRLDYEERYPIKAMYDEVVFDREKQRIRTRLKINYDGGVSYGLRCTLFPDMLMRCSVIIFGISFETLAGSTFKYEWGN